MYIKATWYLLIAILLPVHSSYGQVVELARFDSDSYGRPSQAVEFQGKMFFTAYTSQNGRELWYTDGTVQGTQMLLDINSGTGSSVDNLFHTRAIEFNGELYFQANNGTQGTELWKTDGTPSGTVMVKDANPGSSGSAFSDPVVLGGYIYYVGGATATGLWRTDGTSAGTQFIQSFQILRNLIAYNGRIYFSAGINNTGEELWRYTPATNTAALFKDLNGASGASLPCNFIVVGASLYFTANTSTGWEWWKSNGTASGTQLAVDINPSGNGVLTSYESINVAIIGNEFFFRATDGSTGFQLWKSDGTAVGTQRISNFTQSVDPSMGLPVLNGKVHYTNFEQAFFWAYDPVLGSNQVSNYPSNYGFIFEGNSLKVDDKMVYTAPDSVFGIELRVADGSPGGARMIQETDLLNNWTTSTQQRFNSILGKSGEKILFSNLRTHSDTKYPLFFVDLSQLSGCKPPSIIERVCIDNSTAHILWNRTDGANLYELRFRQKNTATWQLSTENGSFAKYSGLLPNTVYELQIRSSCSGGWSQWSQVFEFNSWDLSGFNSIHIIGERALDANTMQIYWQRSSLIINAQFRYRPIGTTNWTTAGNSNGYRRLNNLTPGTFYQYQYRADKGLGFEPWSSFIFNYFYTPNTLAVSTLPVQILLADSAQAGGEVISDGGSAVLSRGVCWSTSPQASLQNAFSVDGTGLGSFTSTLSPLLPNTSYYYRAYAYTANDTAYGAELNFSTPSLCSFMEINSISKVGNPRTYTVQFSTATANTFVLQSKRSTDTTWTTLSSWNNASLSQRNFQAMEYNASLDLRLGGWDGSSWTYSCVSNFQSDCKPMTVNAIELVSPFCGGDSALLKTVFNGGFRAKSFLWNTGENTRFIYGQQGQTYTVVVTDEAGCSDSASVTVSSTNTSNVPQNFSLAKPNAVSFIGSWSSPTLNTGVSLIGYRMAYRQVNAGAAWMYTPLSSNTSASVDFTGSGLPSANYEFAVFARVNDNGSIGNSNFSCKQRKFYNGIGAKKEDFASGIQVYPNPTANKVRIEGYTAKEVNILDLSGKSWILPVEGDQWVDLSHLKDGVYLLKVEGEYHRIILLK